MEPTRLDIRLCLDNPLSLHCHLRLADILKNQRLKEQNYCPHNLWPSTFFQFKLDLLLFFSKKPRTRFCRSTHPTHSHLYKYPLVPKPLPPSRNPSHPLLLLVHFCSPPQPHHLAAQPVIWPNNVDWFFYCNQFDFTLIF